MNFKYSFFKTNTQKKWTVSNLGKDLPHILPFFFLFGDTLGFAKPDISTILAQSHYHGHLTSKME